jgi:dihydrofolate reductase
MDAGVPGGYHAPAGHREGARPRGTAALTGGGDQAAVVLQRGSGAAGSARSPGIAEPGIRLTRGACRSRRCTLPISHATPNRSRRRIPMRRVRYQVACSLDGFIAGPDDDFGWITPEPSFDFDALYAQFDTLLMGRRTYEIVRAAGEDFRGKKLVVASRTLVPDDHPGIEVVADGLEERVRELRGRPGGDIWLYGGGELFAQLLDWRLVDTVEPAVIPILLGGGIPLLPSPAARRRLELVRHRAYPGGMVLLEYDVCKDG